MISRASRRFWLTLATFAVLVALAWVPLPAAPAQTPQTPAAPAPAPAPQPQRPQIFRSAVDIVSLNVTVVDNQNHYITDIGEGEFSVFEDNSKQDLSFFTRTSLPI